MAEEKRWMGELPTHCDICKKPLTKHFVDGKTRFGPWGNMCVSCHTFDGCGLGTGRGQKYELPSGKKVAG